MPRTRAAQQEWEACSTYVMFYDAIWHFNAFSSLNSICAASFGPFSWSSSSALTQKNLMPGPQRRPPVGTARRHHFLKRDYRYLQLCLTMLCSSLFESHRESSQMLLVSASASCLPSCLHMQLFSRLPPIASPPSRSLLLVHLHIAFRPGQPCKAVAAIGAVLAPSERQRFSLVLF